jgi:hypothetical protein
MSRTSHTLDCGCRACVNEWIDLADDLEAKNKELEGVLAFIEKYHPEEYQNAIDIVGE